METKIWVNITFNSYDQLKGKEENATIFVQSDLTDFPGWEMKIKNNK